MSGRILSPTAGAAGVDLLPGWFRDRQRGRRICANWITLAMLLAAVLVCCGLASWLRVQREQQFRLQMAARAEPILALRQRAQRWNQQDGRRETWCGWVESARPDDSLLQTLAALAAASRVEPPEVVIDEIEIRLPLESAVASSPKPSPATSPTADPGSVAGQLSVLGRVASPEAALRFAQRLNQQRRVEAAKVEAVPDEQTASLTLTATPVATRIVP